MPYDPRLVSEGGNRGAGDTFKLKAPPGKFRVVKVDTFDGGDWVDGDYDTLVEAKRNCIGGEMLKAYIYDDKGNRIANEGRF